MKKILLNLLCSIALLIPLVSRADIAVIVSAKCTTAALSSEEVSRLFLGKLGTFPNGVDAVVLDQPLSIIRNEFYLKLTGKTNTQLKAYWSQQLFTGASRPPKEVSSQEEVLRLVAKNPNVVGYVDKAKVTDSVKVVYILE